MFKVEEQTKLSRLAGPAGSPGVSAIIVAAGSSERFNAAHDAHPEKHSHVHEIFQTREAHIHPIQEKDSLSLEGITVPDCADDIVAPTSYGTSNAREVFIGKRHLAASRKGEDVKDESNFSSSKILEPLAGMPLVCWSVLAADAAPSVSEIILVVRGEDLAPIKTLLAGLPTVVPIVLAQGGKTRQESVRHGLSAVNPLHHFVTVLDGARPLVTSDTIEATIRNLRLRKDLAGVVAGYPSADTLKVVDSDNTVCGTPDRDRYWCIQTPQTFRKADLRDAHTLAMSIGLEGTDDASLVERAGKKVGCLDLQRDNIKVTLPFDLILAEALLSARQKNEKSQQSKRGL